MKHLGSNKYMAVCLLPSCVLSFPKQLTSSTKAEFLVVSSRLYVFATPYHFENIDWNE